MDATPRAAMRLVAAFVVLWSVTGETNAQSNSARNRSPRPRLTLRSHDGPNRATETDLAASRWVDSLFAPDVPGDPLEGKVADAAGEALGVPQSTAVRRGGWQGQLAHNPDNSDGSPPYVLLDRYGGIKRFVEPTSRVDLEAHVGEMVRVRRDTGHTLLATQLDLPQNAPGIDLAQYSEELPPGEIVGEVVGDVAGPMIVPEGVDPVYLDDGIDFGGCDSCGAGVACGPGGCGFASRPILFVRGQYLQWWFDGMQTPPLVQRFTAMPDPADNVNIGTSFGGGELLDDGRNGYRILVGLWFDDYGKWGLEGDYSSFESLRTVFTDGGDGSADPAVGRPYINTDFGRFVENVSTPGLQGTVAVAVDSDFMTSGIRLRHNLCCTQAAAVGCGDCIDCGAGVGCGMGIGCGSAVGPAICPLLHRGLRRTDVVFGLRHAQLEENLRVREDLEVIDLTEEQDDDGFTPPQSGGVDIPIGTTFDVMDDFSTSNEFVGVDLGYIWEWEYRRWSLELASRIALGNTRQRVMISGATTRVLPGPPVTSETAAGGLLTQASNIGRYERDQFSVLPELGATVGFQVTQRFRVTFGYTLLYWSNVVRPGDQIDLAINPDNIPFQTAGSMTEPLLPAFAFDDVSIWAQGISVGADYSW